MGKPHWLDTAWDILVRWRTWVVNVLFAVLIVLPEIIAAPEVAAVAPDKWKPWLAVATLAVNIWMRPRPAVRATDPEVPTRKR